MQDIQARVHRRLLQVQKMQKYQADRHCRHMEFAIGAQVLLSTCNLHLKLPKKLQDRYIVLFRVTSRVELTAYHLDFSTNSALKHFHPTFHISLLRENWDNGLYQQPPPMEIDGDDEWEIERILGHRLFRG